MTEQPPNPEESFLSSSLPITMASPSPSVSCSPSPVWKLSRILRNSFSKLRPKRNYLHSKSKSTDHLKKHKDDDDEGGEEDEEEGAGFVSPVDQEMVLASLRRGLPIIPFPMPNFDSSTTNIEEPLYTRRDNSPKEMKFVVPSSDFSNKRDSQSEVDTGETDYVIHSPEIAEDSPRVEREEEESSYMTMVTMSRRPSHQIVMGRTRPDSEEEPIFHLEQTFHQDQEEERSGRVGVSRRYRKANKHRGDYCLLDMKKRSSSFSSGTTSNSRAWKSITFNKK